MLGEANVLPKESLKYFGKEGESIHLLFNFYVNQHLFSAMASSNAEPLKKALEETRIHYPTAQWANFLRNHDELDLRWITAQQREEVFHKFAPEKTMQVFGRGIRRRLSPMLRTRKMTEFACSLMFSLPGIPVIRYGDEIGMGDDLDLHDRNAVRTPMQWTSEKNAGFSSADKLIHPVISKGEYSYRNVNVESQQRTSSSLLNWMTSLIRLRHECVEIGHGEWKIIETGINSVFVILHVYHMSCILIIHNFDSVAHVCEIRLSEYPVDRLVNLMSSENVEVTEEREFSIRIEAWGYKWYRGSGLAHFTAQ
jgi:maltose alpha-D-glucosyltransferase/alpha-amylase